MDYRLLGSTGLKVSELCMGTMQFGWTADEETSHQVLSAAYQAGINFIDTADIYSRWVAGNPGGVSEEIIGRWIKTAKVPRDKLIIATKVRGQISDDAKDQGLSRRHILKSVEGSLKRLQTDYIDLYQAHWEDQDVPIEETLRAFDDLIQEGKVRFIGCSNYPPDSLRAALASSEENQTARYSSLQPHFNLVNRAEFEQESLGISQQHQLGVIPYSPLAGGFLTGKYRRDADLPKGSRGENSQRIQGYMIDKNWELLAVIEAIAEEKSASISQIALAWLINHPAVTSPIIGPRNLEQWEDNLGAAGLQLTREETDRLDRASAWQ